MHFKIIMTTAAFCLATAAGVAQTNPSPADLEKEFKELRQDEHVAPSAPVLLDANIRRQVATPTIEAEITRTHSLALIKETAANAQDQTVADQREVVNEREREHQKAEDRIKEWRKTIEFMEKQKQSMTDPSAQRSAEQTLTEAREELEKAIEQEKAAKDEAENQQRLLDRLVRKAKNAHDELIAAQKDEAAAIAQRTMWIEKTRKENPLQAGALVQRDTIVIRFRRDASIAEIRKVFDKYHLSRRSGIASISLFVTDLTPDNTLDAEAAARRLQDTIDLLRKEPKVLTAYPNLMLRAPSLPRASTDLPRWNWFTSADTLPARALNLPAAWNFSDAIRRKGDPSVNVLVIDEGFADHVDLHHVVENVCRPVVSDHGTHVAGIIGAEHNGMGIDGYSPFVHIIACAPSELPLVSGITQVFADGMSGWFTEVLKKFDSLLLERHPKVVNASLGYKWGQDLQLLPDTDPFIQALVIAQGDSFRAVIDQHASMPFIVASAAGNDCREDHCTRNAKWTSPFNWAALAPQSEDPDNLAPSDNVFVVESTNAAKQHTPDSNVNGTIAAPGEDILSTVANPANGYDIKGGTSMAAPAITSVVALMFAYNPNLTVADIRRILHVGASPPEVPDAFKALASCRPAAEVAADLTDLNGDGVVNMADFEMFRRALAQIEATNFNRDLNGDGVIDGNEGQFARTDFNGNGTVSRTGVAEMPGFGAVSDLSVMKKSWNDATVVADALNSLLDGGGSLAAKATKP